MGLILSDRKPPKGSSAAALRKWGMVFTVIGIVGRCILENAVIGINGMTNDQLLNAMDSDPAIMAAATASIFCKIMGTCAVPMFAFLLVEGFRHTASIEKYLLRVLGLAVVTEIPYNLAMGGSLIDLGSRNPVFGLALCLMMLWFYRRYPGMSLQNVLMKVVLSAAAIAWCLMLRVYEGICFAIMVIFLWTLRNKTNMRAIYGFCGAIVCSLVDRYYIGACLSCILLHRYTEERGEQNRVLSYGFYPVCLLILGIAAKFI